ncbi:MAG: ATP-binding cassette domain-containing protein [Acidobacteria bacterium]|nr:ATP-binding cassette domain-containing protein [Acidobacteriota bacterium]
MAMMVQVQDLAKEFRTFRRREGVWGAFQNLFVREYQTVKAVDGISFDIAPGEMVGYIGPNGAGKSTTVKMLTGILVPTRGVVYANGFVPYRDRLRYTKTIGVVFGQRTQLWWDIAVIESLKLLRKIYDVSWRDFQERLEHFDQLLRLKDYLNTPVRKLSLGERMRCDLVAALLHRPKLLFLDEPTIGLDIVAKKNIREFLKEINRRDQTTVLLTTHDLSDIEELCQRIMVIDHGRLLYDGRLQAFKEQLGRWKQVKFFLKDRGDFAELESLFAGDTLQCERLDDLTARILFLRDQVSSAEVIKKVLSRLEVRDIAIEEESIEEIVKNIYQKRNPKL